MDNLSTATQDAHHAIGIHPCCMCQDKIGLSTWQLVFTTNTVNNSLQLISMSLALPETCFCYSWLLKHKLNVEVYCSYKYCMIKNYVDTVNPKSSGYN